jgi:hypothetical protein
MQRVAAANLLRRHFVPALEVHAMLLDAYAIARVQQMKVDIRVFDCGE